MSVSRGGATMFRRVPTWLNVLGGLLLVFQLSALAFVPFVGDAEPAPPQKPTVSVVYQLTGTAPKVNARLTTVGGGTEDFDTSLPLRREFEARRGAPASILGFVLPGRPGEVTCTLTIDGAIVAQQTGRTATCSGTAGETPPLDHPRTSGG